MFYEFPCNVPQYHLQVVCIFYILQERLFPMIYLHWKKYQENMMQRLKEVGEALVMAGDGRHDSMGHSAKYGAYTIFCCTLSKIVHFSLVQVRNYLFLLPYYRDIHS